MNSSQMLAWAALPAATATVMLLPLLPALREWWRPRDTRPLHIDAQDALDPTYMARSFSARLAESVARGDRKLGQSRLMLAPERGSWPLKDEEWKRGRNAHVWHAAADVQMPDGVHFLGEVATPATLETAPGCVYRALWSGARLRLVEHGHLLRWAHGRQVEVGTGCRLAGRVTADETLTVWGRSFFLLLHAPVISFGTRPGGQRIALAAPRRAEHGGLPPEVDWDPVSGRGVAAGDLRCPEWSAWRGDLLCRGDLEIGTGSHADGSLKAHGELTLQTHCRIQGSAFAEGRITVGESVQVLGNVCSETAIALEPGCVIGSPERPATVSAPRIDIGPGVIVHGTVWAAERGQTRHETPTPPETALVPAERRRRPSDERIEA